METGTELAWQAFGLRCPGLVFTPFTGYVSGNDKAPCSIKVALRATKETTSGLILAETVSADFLVTALPELAFATTPTRRRIAAGTPHSFAPPALVGHSGGTLTYSLERGYGPVTVNPGDVCPGLRMDAATGVMSNDG